MVRRQFIFSKISFLNDYQQVSAVPGVLSCKFVQSPRFSLIVFMLSQAILPKLQSADES